MTTRVGSRVGRTVALTPFALVALALALRAFHLGVQSFWLDEALSVIFARPPLSDLLPRLVTQDIHPPFYVLALHFWMQVAGDSEFAVRYVSTAFGVLLVPLVYRLAIDLFREGDDVTGEARLSGVIAAALVAVSPFLVYYSQEARNYIVVTFWTVLSCLSLWRALSRGTRRWWGIYAVANALVIYTHYYGGFVIAAQGVYLALTWWQHRRKLFTWALSGVGTVVLYLPWLVGFKEQFTHLWQSPDYWLGSIDFATIVSRTFASFALGKTGGPTQLIAVFGVIFALGFGALLTRGGLRTRRGELFLIFYASVPLLIVYAITASNPKFAERYLIIISPAFYLVLARGLAALYGMGRRFSANWLPASGVGTTSCLLGTALAIGLSASATWQVYSGPDWAKDDYRGAIGYIQSHAQPGDFILLTRNAWHPMEYYYHGTAPWEGYDPASANVAPNPAGVAAYLDKTLRGSKRVWLLLWQEEVVDATRTVAGLLGKFGQKEAVDATFTGVRLELYDLPGQVTFRSEPAVPLDALFENGVRLRGLDLLTPRVRSGDNMDLGLYWQATRMLTEEFGLSLSLKDEKGFTWAAETHPPTGQYLPATRWPTAYPVRGEYLVRVPPGTPPGRYNIEMNVHQASTLRELSRVMASGQPVGTRLVIGHVEVLPAAAKSQPSLADLRVAQAKNAVFTLPNGREALGLLGRGDLPVELRQGARVDLSLYWEGSEGTSGDYEAVLELANGQTRQLARAPVMGGYPASAWSTGERLRGQYSLAVPPDLPPEAYDLRLALVPSGQNGRLRTGAGADFVSLGKVTVQAMARQMQAPAVGQRQGTDYGGVAELYGFDVTSPPRVKAGDKIELGLVWRAEATPATAYRVFVHLADANQRPWAQHDGEPAAGARPTTGWIASEYVIDPRQLTVGADVPTGRYQLLVGVYGPDGARLQVQGADAGALNNAVALKGLQIEVVK
ncbi:MAG: glycosyltransferase family 39 protein [Chloroflexota bacterium]